MTAVTFDTLKFVETLEQAKLPREQASAIASAVQTSLTQTLAERDQNFASKRDVSELRKDTDSKFDLLRKDIAALEQRIDAKISALDCHHQRGGPDGSLLAASRVSASSACVTPWRQSGKVRLKSRCKLPVFRHEYAGRRAGVG